MGGQNVSAQDCFSYHAITSIIITFYPQIILSITLSNLMMRYTRLLQYTRTVSHLATFLFIKILLHIHIHITSKNSTQFQND